MAISERIQTMMSGSSFIRKMFETGSELKNQYGSENVFDFSLGNPSMRPPDVFNESLLKAASDHLHHAYMPNAGYPEVRTSVARFLSKEQHVPLTEKNIIMTTGAGGALNIILKTILNPGDTVIASTPCFMEYKFYCDNHGGTLVLAEGTEDFNLNVSAIEAAITPQTAAVIINSPNNPSGRVYPEETIKELSAMLSRKSRDTGRTIYLISDEPYRKIVYDGITVPSILDHYNNSVICTSYSKDLSIPGERIGWLAVHPEADDFENLIAGAILCNRILGYVNAPAVMQRTIAELQGVSVDIGQYKKKRDLLVDELQKMGYRFRVPEGTFYLFVKAPGGDDLKIVDELLQERILVVPGRGFSYPGFFRIAYCVKDSVIEGSLPGFKRALKRIEK